MNIIFQHATIIGPSVLFKSGHVPAKENGFSQIWTRPCQREWF